MNKKLNLCRALKESCTKQYPNPSDALWSCNLNSANKKDFTFNICNKKGEC